MQNNWVVIFRVKVKKYQKVFMRFENDGDGTVMFERRRKLMLRECMSE